VQAGDPVGLDLRIEADAPVPLRVVADGTYHVAVLDLVVEHEGPDDLGPDPIRDEGLFAPLTWRGLREHRTEWRPEGEGWIRQSVFVDAAWMHAPSTLTLTVRDADDAVVGGPVLLDAGRGHAASPTDAFAIRRPAVIVTAEGCPDSLDLTGATFHAEGLFQLRNPIDGRTPSFGIPEGAVALEVVWSQRPDHPLRIPLELVAPGSPGYGFAIEAALEGDAADGHVEPGDPVPVRLTFRDGDGRRLHPVGSLPTYTDFLAGRANGLRYFAFEQGVLYFRDKNDEGVLLAAVSGPEHAIRQAYSEVATESLVAPSTVVAEPDRDGYFAAWRMIPPGDVLFGGAFGDPDAWDTPVSDLLPFTIPADVEAGTYRFTVKARREWLGESRLATATVTFEVGDGGEPIVPWVGGCERCHEEGLDLGDVLHRNPDVATCNGCHVPLDFEPDNLLAYRMHYVHYFSPRYDDPKGRCRSCHQVVQSVHRPSYMACLGCHLEYHGGAEGGLYGQCADVVYCHPDHNFPSVSSFEVDAPWGRDDDGEAPRSLHDVLDVRASIPFRLDEPGPVSITVYDVGGREVSRVLEDARRGAGEHVAAWDGRDRRGRRLAAGVYLARITGSDRDRTVRLLLR